MYKVKNNATSPERFKPNINQHIELQLTLVFN